MVMEKKAHRNVLKGLPLATEVIVAEVVTAEEEVVIEEVEETEEVVTVTAAQEEIIDSEKVKKRLPNGSLFFLIY